MIHNFLFLYKIEKKNQSKNKIQKSKTKKLIQLLNQKKKDEKTLLLKKKKLNQVWIRIKRNYK